MDNSSPFKGEWIPVQNSQRTRSPQKGIPSNQLFYSHLWHLLLLLITRTHLDWEASFAALWLYHSKTSKGETRRIERNTPSRRNTQKNTTPEIDEPRGPCLRFSQQHHSVWVYLLQKSSGTGLGSAADVPDILAPTFGRLTHDHDLTSRRRGDRPLAWSNVRNEPTHNQPVVQLLRGATSQIRSYGRYDGGRGEGTKNKRNKRKQNVFKRLFSWVLFLFSSFGFVEQRGINDNKTIFLVPFGCVTAWRHPPLLHHFETWIICLVQRERECLLADHFYDELSGELTFRQTCEIHIMLQLINECSRIFCSSLSLPYTLHYQHSTYGTDAQYLHINFRVSYSIRLSLLNVR